MPNQLRESLTSHNNTNFHGTYTLIPFVKKARRIIGLIHWHFHLAPSLLRRSLYITMVRPILEYSCVTAWNLSKDLLVVSYYKPGTIRNFYLAHLSQPLSLAVIFTQSSMFFKILNNLSSAPNVFIPHTRQNIRSNHSHSLHIPFSRLTLCQKSFYNYGPKLWNKLSEENINCTTLHSFKAAVVPIV